MVSLISNLYLPPHGQNKKYFVQGQAPSQFGGVSPVLLFNRRKRKKYETDDDDDD
jgi:hypothetical protein